MSWFGVLRNRGTELARDTMHSFHYGDRNVLTKGVTRARIVDIYETAYSELAESYAGMKDAYDDIRGQLSTTKHELKFQMESVEEAQHRIKNLERERAGLMDLITRARPYNPYD
jgi:predicted nuclease with TOPRIM domain